MHEQMNDPVLSIVRKVLQDNDKNKLKTVQYRQPKGLRAYMNHFEDHCLVGNLLRIKKYFPDSPDFSVKICVPLSLILKVFELSHRNCYAGHFCKEKALPIIQRFFFWPGLYKWVHALCQDCLDYQKNKQKRKDVNEAPLEPNRGLVRSLFLSTRFKLTTSRGKRHCLVVVDAFSRFIQVYSVASVGADDTIKAFENFILSFGIPQKPVFDRGSGFMSEEFASWTHELGITNAPRSSHSPWTNGKVESQNKHLVLEIF